MATLLPKALVIFCFNLCASLYIGAGTYGATLDLFPGFLGAMPLWSSPAAAVGLLALIQGICYFGRLRDRIAAREAAHAPVARKENAGSS